MSGRVNRSKTWDSVLEILGLFTDSPGTDFWTSNCPYVPFLCVRVKMNDGVGCLALGECLVVF